MPGGEIGEAKGYRQKKRRGVMRGDAEISCNEIRQVYMRGFCGDTPHDVGDKIRPP